MQKESIRLKIALRNAANAIGNLNESTPIRDFFTRINFRKGRVSAIPATARKLALYSGGVPLEHGLRCRTIASCGYSNATF